MEDKRLFDKFEHIGVYVVDRKSMIVYYENPIAQKFTGRCRIGEPCYQVHGNDRMCSSCPIRQKDHITLVNRADYNMVFAVRCEEVVWDGKDSYLITVVKQGDSAKLTEDEKSMSRMSRALQKSVSVYSEISMETMEYRQINLNNTRQFNAAGSGIYTDFFDELLKKTVHPDDVEEVRRKMAPEALRRVSFESDGVQEASVRYRLNRATPERILESRAIFLRDEVPHYVVILTKDVTQEYELRKQADAMENILSHVNCGVAIYSMDESGAITVDYANEGLARLAECDKDELMRQYTKDAMYGIQKEYRDEFSKAFDRIAAGEKSANGTLQATTYKGNRLWLSASLTAFQKEDGILLIYGTFFDVTADVKAKKEFGEKYELEKRRSQDDTSVLAYAVFDLKNDTTLEMDRRSPLAKMETQLSLEEFCEDISHSIVWAEKKTKFLRIFNRQALLQMHEKGVDEQSLEYQRRLSNGNVTWVKSSFRVMADPSKNSVLLFYYCNDINFSKNLELMTAYMVDEDYDIIGCINLMDDSAIMLYGKTSSRRIAGREEPRGIEQYSEALEWFANNAVVPEEREFYRANASADKIRETLFGKKSFELMVHVYDPNRNIRTKKVRYTRADVSVGNCFFSQVDVTDTLAEEEAKQRRLQEALESAKQANEAKTAFLSRMSHDMRTPMNGVLGLASLMREETDPAELARDIDQLEMSGRYLLQLINDTLDVSKIESGKMELRLKPMNSELVFGNIFSNANLLAKEKGVELRVTKPEIKHGDWVEVMGDASRLEQVIMNVVSNAIKFTPAGGLVHVIMETLSITNEEVIDRYIIRDTGIGMSKEFLDNIYEPFAQEGRINTDRESGTGLGMPIVKQVVELMHGSISIKSEINKGTEVTLVMHYPICKQQTAPKQAEQTNLSVLRDKRILLCEDHPLNAQIARRLLGKEGIKVEHAKNGKEGVAMFAQAAPGYYDMILMDIRMPEMNGLEATKAIRTMNRQDAEKIPIIAMTANAFDDDVKECLCAGMNGHIAKPIEPAIMYETIAKNL